MQIKEISPRLNARVHYVLTLSDQAVIVFNRSRPRNN
jgi:hypothetical protein